MTGLAANAVSAGREVAAFDPTDTEAVRAALAAFVSARTRSAAEIGPLRRFTVGFSWVTYGFSARWSEDGVPFERELILRAGPPTGIFGPYRAFP